jgi:hypothetical protein
LPIGQCNREADVTTTTQAVATRPAATVVVVSTAGFLVGLDLFIVNIAFAEIRQTFGAADFGAMSWILNAYTLVFAAFMNPAGRLGDRYGHRRIFLCGLVVFTLGSALCGLSGSFVALVGARVVQALGAAMLMPSSLALLLAAVPAGRRAVVVSTWSAVAAMAAALGPPVGGFLAISASSPDCRRRFGLAVVAATGAALYVVGIGIWLCTIGTVPDYFTDYLPAQLFTGGGVGLVMPSLSAVTGVALPSYRWGAGSAVTNTARQLGMVLGTTALTMIYQPDIDLAAVRRGWAFVAVAAGMPHSSRPRWRSGGKLPPTSHACRTKSNALAGLLINWSGWLTSPC